MPFGGRSLGPLARGLVGFAAIAAIFFFLGRSLASDWSELRAEEVDLRLWWLALAFVPGAAAILVMAYGWRTIVGFLTGGHPSLHRLPQIFVYSWLGRYVPGKVAYVVGRFYLGRQVGVTAPVLIGSMAYENILLLVAALAFAAVTIMPSLVVASESLLPYVALPLIAAGGVAVLHPRLLGWGLALAQRVTGRGIGVQRLLAPGQMARVMGIFAVTFTLNGLGLYLLIISLTSYSVGYLPLVMGAFALAGVIGIVSVFAPAGLGVREGILVAVLQTTMPVEMAALVSLVARVWAVAVDLLVVGGSFAFDYVSGERLLLSALAGRTEAAGAPADAVDPG